MLEFDDGIDDFFVSTAVHEAGHAIIWKLAGLDIEKAKISGEGYGSHGFVRLTGNSIFEESLDDYLIGLAGGQQAELIAIEKYGLIVSPEEVEYCSGNDLNNFRKFSKDSTLNLAGARSEARSIISINWAQNRIIGY